MKFSNLISKESIQNLIKNFNLLQIVSKLERNTCFSKMSSISDVKSIQTKTSEKHNNFEMENTYNEFSQSKYLLCGRHHLISHSITLRGDKLLCEKCIAEDKVETKPIPAIILDLKSKIQTGLTQINLLDNEIDRLKSFFKSYLNEFNDSNKKKIETLFSYLNKIVQYNYNSAKQLLNQCSSRQKTQLNNIIPNLQKMKFELRSLQEELNYYQNLKDESLFLQKWSRFFAINKRIKEFIDYKKELDLSSLKVCVKEDIQNSLLNSIQDSYSIKINFTNINGQLPTIKHILQKETHWTCVCGETVSIFDLSKLLVK